MQILMNTPLWQAMPFVRQQRFQRVPAVWFYGTGTFNGILRRFPRHVDWP
jgi:ABC-type Fe3+-hydroxamate transport system substrate-binding protein